MTNYRRPTVGGTAVIRWDPPPSAPVDWFMGTGATAGERATVWAGTVVGVALVIAHGAGAGWAWWQWVLVVILAVDVVGGVTANALGSAKRLYHGPVPAGATRLQRLLHDEVVFTAAHVHPFVVALALPGGTWVWAVTWYLLCLVGVVAVRAVPLHLRRPTAFALMAASLVLAPAVAAPTALEWFGPVLALKLVAAHAVPEEPYRPERERRA